MYITLQNVPHAYALIQRTRCDDFRWRYRYYYHRNVQNLHSVGVPVVPERAPGPSSDSVGGNAVVSGVADNANVPPSAPLDQDNATAYSSDTAADSCEASPDVVRVDEQGAAVADDGTPGNQQAATSVAKTGHLPAQQSLLTTARVGATKSYPGLMVRAITNEEYANETDLPTAQLEGTDALHARGMDSPLKAVRTQDFGSTEVKHNPMPRARSADAPAGDKASRHSHTVDPDISMPSSAAGKYVALIPHESHAMRKPTGKKHGIAAPAIVARAVPVSVSTSQSSGSTVLTQGDTEQGSPELSTRSSSGGTAKIRVCASDMSDGNVASSIKDDNNTTVTESAQRLTCARREIQSASHTSNSPYWQRPWQTTTPSPVPHAEFVNQQRKRRRSDD